MYSYQIASTRAPGTPGMSAFRYQTLHTSCAAPRNSESFESLFCGRDRVAVERQTTTTLLLGRCFRNTFPSIYFPTPRQMFLSEHFGCSLFSTQPTCWTFSIPAISEGDHDAVIIKVQHRYCVVTRLTSSSFVPFRDRI